MLSIETAKKLKDAGLVWNPDIGDIFFIEEEWLFAPRLDQLLAEIEKRGYGWKLEKFHAYNLRRMQIYKINDLLGCFEADSPEEAAAQALLWILEQKK